MKVPNFCGTVVLLLNLFGYGSPLAQTQLPAPFHPCLSAGIKKSVVFLGTFGALPESKERLQPIYFGTGFLITIDDIFYLVTAKHIIERF